MYVVSQLTCVKSDIFFLSLQKCERLLLHLFCSDQSSYFQEPASPSVSLEALLTTVHRINVTWSYCNCNFNYVQYTKEPLSGQKKKIIEAMFYYSVCSKCYSTHTRVNQFPGFVQFMRMKYSVREQAQQTSLAKCLTVCIKHRHRRKERDKEREK